MSGRYRSPEPRKLVLIAFGDIAADGDVVIPSYPRQTHLRSQY